MQFEPLFIDASNRYGIPAGLLSRQAKQESAYNPLAVNRLSNAQGLMQIVPRWHPDMANGKAFQPALAVPYAAKYLAELHRQFGTWAKALAAYNWGPGNLAQSATPYGDKWLEHVPVETYYYVKDIVRDTGVV